MRIMTKKDFDQKITILITFFGIAIIVLAGINRLFLDNTVISGIVVALSILFFIVLIWLYARTKKKAKSY